MANLRLIARLDTKNENLIKGVNFEGLRVIGPLVEYLEKYYLDGADELLLMDAVASLYGRNHLSSFLTAASKSIFVPVTAGGGISSLEMATEILRSGADKIAINTAVVKDPTLITAVADKFGSQAMVVSIDAKFNGGHWEVYIDGGREKTGIKAIEWAQTAAQCGAGEILLTSVDRDGTQRGFDIDLIKAVNDAVDIPIVASGGMGRLEDISNLADVENLSGVAIGSMLHYNLILFSEIRKFATSNKILVREHEI